VIDGGIPKPQSHFVENSTKWDLLCLGLPKEPATGLAIYTATGFSKEYR
jgi:hypothetical protein